MKTSSFVKSVLTAVLLAGAANLAAQNPPTTCPLGHEPGYGRTLDAAQRGAACVNGGKGNCGTGPACAAGTGYGQGKGPGKGQGLGQGKGMGKGQGNGKGMRYGQGQGQGQGQRRGQCNGTGTCPNGNAPQQ